METRGEGRKKKERRVKMVRGKEKENKGRKREREKPQEHSREVVSNGKDRTGTRISLMFYEWKYNGCFVIERAFPSHGNSFAAFLHLRNACEERPNKGKE